MSEPNFDNRTLFIQDNLHVLRGMNSECVDLIYLDPPFNSKREYKAPIGSQAEGQRFDDTWKWTQLDQRWLGEIDRRNEALSAVIEASRLTQGEGTAAYLCFMGIRLLELRRVLKREGSIWLHCDDTAGHYIKLLMDAVFGARLYKSDLTWRRVYGHGNSKSFARVADNILCYSGSNLNMDAVRIPLDDEYIKAKYTRQDERGLYHDISLSAPLGGGYTYDFHGHNGPWVMPRETATQMEADGLIYIPERGSRKPRKKRYLHEDKGRVPTNILTHINPINSQAKESTGWATQKPLELLDLFIKAGSKPGDLVLDPFAGCATALIAAEMLDRRWVGIEACDAANDILLVRLSEADLGELGAASSGATVTRKMPVRTDLNGDEEPIKSRGYKSQENMDHLYGVQRGICIGCGNHYRSKDFHFDHIIPRSAGGGHSLDNLQLLCGHCNSTKGTGTMQDLEQRLEEQRR